jgi:hypothetical protein
MPWVVADYHSEFLDFDQPETFRDLAKVLLLLCLAVAAMRRTGLPGEGVGWPVLLVPSRNAWVCPLRPLEPAAGVVIAAHAWCLSADRCAGAQAPRRLAGALQPDGESAPRRGGGG